MSIVRIADFADRDPVPVYRCQHDKERGLPDGLNYVDSWIEANFNRCFQIMECDDLSLLQDWVLYWRGTGVTFEIVPVSPSKDVQGVVAPHL